MFDIGGTLDLVFNGLALVLKYWWIYLPVLLGLAAYDEWMEYQQIKFISSLKWILLEIIAPPEILFSSPKAAESIFAGLHSSYAGFPGTTLKKQFFEGKVPVWFSLEIVSNGGEVHFYLRCTEDQRDVVESLIFAQYPESEIRPVEDYVNLLPAKLDLGHYDVAGAELEFVKEQAYPIKTFPEFEEAGGKDEYARLDPLSPLLEILGALKSGEYLWLQYVIRATSGDWAKEGQATVDKLSGKPAPKPGPVLEWLFGPLEAVLGALSGAAPAEPKKEEKVQFNLQNLTPAQKVILEQVEYKLAKLAFKAGIRLLYTAPKEAFNGSRIASVTGMFKQLYYTNLNSFKPGNSTRDKGFLKWLFPSDKGFFADERVVKKKHKMYEAYRKRTFPEKDKKEMLVILTTEELATLWHLPALNVKSQMLPRVQAKKGQPPPILPTR